MQRKKGSEKNSAIFAILLMGVLWSFAMLYFLGSTRIQLQKQAMQHLDAASQRCAARVEAVLASKADALRAVAQEALSLPQEESLDPLKFEKYRDIFHIRGAALYQPEGQAVFYGEWPAPKEEALATAWQGSAPVLVSGAQEVPDASLLLLPLYADGKVERVCGVYLKDGGMLAGEDVNGAQWLLLDKSGHILAPGNALAWWNTQGLVEDGSLATPVLEALQGSDGGKLAAAYFQSNGHGNYIACTPLSLQGFYVLYAAGQAQVEASYRFLVNNYFVLGLVMIGIFALGLMILLIWRGKERYRVQEEKDRLLWLEERYRIIARESEDVIFEISLKEKGIEANENFRKLFGYNVAQWDKEYKKQVHPDDMEKFDAIYEGIKSGKRIMKDELRFRHASGRYIWCKLLIAVLLDASGKPVRVMGKITNIDLQKREAAMLLQKAQQDSLTNLYNNETTKLLVGRYLAAEGAEGTHGLILLDIDNFKSINDTRGHLSGDAILAAVAEKLRALFRSTDILGRIGGDEFMIFLKNVSDRVQLIAQAQNILDAFRGSEALAGVTCSLGAALYEEDGRTVDELFENADTALYRSKKAGKNRCCIYDAVIDVRTAGCPDEE